MLRVFYYILMVCSFKGSKGVPASEGQINPFLSALFHFENQKRRSNNEV